MNFIFGQQGQVVEDSVIQNLIARLERDGFGSKIPLTARRVIMQPLTWAIDVELDLMSVQDWEPKDSLSLVLKMAKFVGADSYLFRGYDGDVPLSDFWDSGPNSVTGRSYLLGGVPMSLTGSLFTIQLSWLMEFLLRNSSLPTAPVECEFEFDNKTRMVLYSIRDIFTVAGNWKFNIANSSSKGNPLVKILPKEVLANAN